MRKNNNNNNNSNNNNSQRRTPRKSVCLRYYKSPFPVGTMRIIDVYIPSIFSR